VIYLDSSTVVAELLVEDRVLPRSAWRQSLVSSRLLEYEVWTRLHSRGLASSHRAEAQAIISHVDLIELAPVVLARALEPFAVAVRTLDALHLATIEFLRARRDDIELASFDERMLRAARTLDIAIYEC
jgi:hypothetical protein